MGQAKVRGTKEQRVAMAIDRNNALAAKDMAENLERNRLIRNNRSQVSLAMAALSELIFITGRY